MKKSFLILTILFLFSCQKESENFKPSSEILSQKAYYIMLRDINKKFDLILNESKPKDISLSDYKIELIENLKYLENLNLTLCNAISEDFKKYLVKIENKYLGRIGKQLRLVYRMEDDTMICEHCKGENGNEFSSGELTADQIIQHMQVAVIFSLSYEKHILTRDK